MLEKKKDEDETLRAILKYFSDRYERSKDDIFNFTNLPKKKQVQPEPEEYKPNDGSPSDDSSKDSNEEDVSVEERNYSQEYSDEDADVLEQKEQYDKFPKQPVSSSLQQKNDEVSDTEVSDTDDSISMSTE